jgi:hypothetical protein
MNIYLYIINSGRYDALCKGLWVNTVWKIDFYALYAILDRLLLTTLKKVFRITGLDAIFAYAKGRKLSRQLQLGLN